MPTACHHCDPLPCLEWHPAAISVRKWFRGFVTMAIKPLEIPQKNSAHKPLLPRSVKEKP